MLYFVILLTFQFALTKLLGSVVLMRHGSRAPKYFPEQNQNLYFDIGSYGLTINGYHQASLLGLYLNNRYTRTYDLLKEDVRSEDIKLYSTSTQRTLFTLSGVTSTLFPGADLNFRSNNQKLTFNQPPPLPAIFRTKKLNVEILDLIEPQLHSWKCKFNDTELVEIFKYESLSVLDSLKLNDTERSSIVGEVFKGLPFLNKTEISHNEVIKIAVDYLRCSDFLTGNNTFGLTDEARALIKKVSLDKWYSYRLREENKATIETVFSTFFENLKNYLVQRSKGSVKTRLTIFSGHDTNIVDTLVNLIDRDYLIKLINMAANGNDEVFNFLVPPFNSNILFELYEYDGKHYVRMIYNGMELKDHFAVKTIYVKDKGIELDGFISLLNAKIHINHKSLICPIYK
jgi:hypothetical protein